MAGKVIEMATRKVVNEGIEQGAKKTAKANIKNASKIAKPGTKAVKRTAEESYERAYRQLELEDVFSNAEKVGNNKNHIYVDKNSDIVGRYAENLKNNPNNQKAALNSSVKSKMSPEEAAYQLEMKTEREAREKFIEQTREKSSTAKQNAINREIRDNYADGSNLGEEIASGIEQRSGYVGKGPQASKPEMPGQKPVLNNHSTADLKGKMYDSKDDYMKYVEGRDYDEAIDKFKTGDYNNPILKKLEKEGTEMSSLNVDKLTAMRGEAIQGATGKNMGLVDNMGYYQVPQKAAAAGGTMWLVNKLASSNGQQTNAQLYGQQPY